MDEQELLDLIVRELLSECPELEGCRIDAGWSEHSAFIVTPRHGRFIVLVAQVDGESI